MLDAASLPLAPLLLWQGLRLRRTFVPLPEPPGAREGATGTGPGLRLLVLGDSAAAGVGAPHQDQALLGCTVRTLAAEATVHWRLVARTGATAAGTLAHLGKVPVAPVDAVLVSLGVNDLTGGGRPAAYRAAMGALVDHLQARGAGTVVLSGLPPMDRFPALPQPLRWHLGRGARRFDAVLREVAASRPGCLHLPLPQDGPGDLMATDGFHPGPDLYQAWGAAAGAAIRAARGLG